MWTFDTVLVAVLLGLAWRALTTADLFKAVVLFIVFGLFLALAWARLGAIDVALAEVAIGAGITGVLLLTAERRLAVAVRRVPPEARAAGARQALLLVGLGMALLVCLVWGVVSLPPDVTGQRQAVTEHLAHAGVSHPVTAVLLNFRGYDTLLELAVLLLVLLAVWSLGKAPEDRRGLSPPGPVLLTAVSVLVPLLVVVAAYLLWIGAYAPGGAFHAGAVLASAGVLLVLGGWWPPPSWARAARVGLVVGPLTFVAVAALVMLAGGGLLQYPRAWSKTLILLVEAAATVSVGLTLVCLYLGGQPAAWMRKAPR